MVETKCNSIVAAKLETDASLDIDVPMKGDAQNVEVGEHGREEESKG